MLGSETKPFALSASFPYAIDQSTLRAMVKNGGNNQLSMELLSLVHVPTFGDLLLRLLKSQTVLKRSTNIKS